MKPKGGIHIFEAIIGPSIFIVMFACSFFGYPERWVLAFIGEVIVGVLFFLEVRGLVTYQIRITSTEVIIPEQRDFLNLRMKLVTIQLVDLHSIYVSGGIDRYGLYERLNFHFENESEQVINVIRFSDYQLCDIIDKIKENAEALNGKPVILEEDQMQKGFRKKDFVAKPEMISNHDMQQKEHGSFHAPFAIFGGLTMAYSFPFRRLAFPCRHSICPLHPCRPRAAP